VGSPRAWVLAAAVASVAIGIAFAVEAARVAPVRLGFSICAGMMVALGVGCAIAALRGRIQ